MNQTLKLKLTFTFLMSFVMSLVMSFSLMAINTGVDADYLTRSLHGFTIAFPIGFCTSMMVSPVLNYLMKPLREKDPETVADIDASYQPGITKC